MLGRLSRGQPAPAPPANAHSAPSSTFNCLNSASHTWNSAAEVCHHRCFTLNTPICSKAKTIGVQPCFKMLGKLITIIINELTEQIVSAAVPTRERTGALPPSHVITVAPEL